jgi:hypothetical protein
MRITKSLHASILLSLIAIPVSVTSAQSVHVAVGKLPSIPKACEGLISADIQGQIDIPALTREANCKGSGDMLIEYTYVMEYTSHSKDKQGNEQSETRVFEVYIPTLKDGAKTRGVLIMTSRNGVPVPPAKMEKVRREAGEQLEKEENRVARQKNVEPAQQPIVGLKPLGMYPRLTMAGSTLGFNRRGVTLDVHTILEQTTLAYLGREDVDGRENLVFSFVPVANLRLDTFEGYVARIRGKIWLDVNDRIVTRLSAWPVAANSSMTKSKESAPAIYLAMLRLPDGNWLPRESRVMASEYPQLFDGVISDAIVKYTDYQRFKTESKDAKIDGPRVPR